MRRWFILLAAIAIVFAAVLFIGSQRQAGNVADSKKQTADGIAAFRKGEFDEAVINLKKATKADPKNAEAQSGLGRSLEATGELNEAAKAYRASLAVKADQPEVLYNLAIILKSQGKNWKAVAELEKAIAVNEKFVGARLTLGDIYVQLDRKEKAKDQYQAVLDMKPFGVDLKSIKTKLGALK